MGVAEGEPIAPRARRSAQAGSCILGVPAARLRTVARAPLACKSVLQDFLSDRVSARGARPLQSFVPNRGGKLQRRSFRTHASVRQETPTVSQVPCGFRETGTRPGTRTVHMEK